MACAVSLRGGYSVFNTEPDWASTSRMKFLRWSCEEGMALWPQIQKESSVGHANGLLVSVPTYASPRGRLEIAFRG